MRRRVRVDLDRMEFGVLNKLFVDLSEAYLSALEAQRAAEKARKAPCRLLEVVSRSHMTASMISL